ncbi:MAG: DUF4179 domain-containing protein [Ruminococcus sp.]|nr:DUF4179 domain-containing protein [Ruminococcus sp.]
MKTTFKTVFCELDDELVNIDIPANGAEDIDVEKIKGEVMMRINSAENNDSKKKIGKRIFVILAAAVLVVGLTAGAFATGSVQAVFGSIFKNSGDLNEFGLYDGGNVEITTEDDNLDVRLLGVFGDGEKMYSSIRIAHKDGSPMIGEEYYINNGLSPQIQGEFVNTVNGENAENYDGLDAYNTYELTDDNKTLNIYTVFRRGSGAIHDSKDYRITYHSKKFGAYKIDKELYSEEAPVEIDESEWTEEEERAANEEYERYWQMLEQLRKENGLTEDECIYIEHEGRTVYAEGGFVQEDLPFTISFDINYDNDHQIEFELTTETAPDVLESYSENGKIVISPLGIYVSATCEDKAWGSDWEHCVNPPWFDGKSKVEMDDGTVYYIIISPFGECYTDENGVFHDTSQMDYSIYSQNPRHRVPIHIDIDKIQTVIINGDTVYQK